MLKERITFVSVCDFKYCSIYRYFLMPLHFNFIERAIGRNPGDERRRLLLLRLLCLRL